MSALGLWPRLPYFSPVGLKSGSALFRHEVAYVLGQIRSEACVGQLIEALGDMSENGMVRHECAEALGAIASEQATAALRRYLGDRERVVSESCIVALDMSEHVLGDQFQYSDALRKVAMV